MSYNERVQELENCKLEKKRLASKTKLNNKRINELKTLIAKAMETRGQPVGKLGEKVFSFKEKPVLVPKTKVEKAESVKEILREVGVRNVDDLFAQLERAQKGETKIVKELRVETANQYEKRIKKIQKSSV